MYITTTGLILRETEYKESSKILTVLTPENGKITVSAKGVRRRGSKLAAATQFLSYAEMTLFCNRNRWTLTEARPIALFEGLREDVELLALGAYFAELLEVLSDAETAVPEMLSLGLNGLYALSESLRPAMLVKAAFELRLVSMAGFAPLLDGCAGCGAADINSAYLDLSGGVIYCENCVSKGTGKCLPLRRGALSAARHIAEADVRRVFSFSLGEEALKQLADACEAYAVHQLDHEYGSLSYYKRITS